MQEYKEWDENVLLGPAPTIQNVHKGDIIKAMEHDGDVGRGTIPREYEVVEVYKRTVLTRDRKTGFRRCFSYGDLLTMKIERQDPKVESIKEKRTQEGYNQSTEGKSALKSIEKKILPKYFRAVRKEEKNFELRKDEDNAQPGDVLILMEWENGEYTGRTEVRRIRYVLRNMPEYGLMPGYCIIGW